MRDHAPDDDMTISQIRAELDALVAAMLAKGVKTPSANLTIYSNARYSVALWCDMDAAQFDGEYLKHRYGDSLTEAISAAHAYIATLPDPANEGLRKFTRHLAAAIDTATEYALPDEVVAPARDAIGKANDLMALPAP